MNPVEPNRYRRRIALYCIAALAIVLVPLFFAYWLWQESPASGDEFARLMKTGKSYYEQGPATNAVEAFQSAVVLQPTHPEALLNLANARLLAGQSEEAIKSAL